MRLIHSSCVMLTIVAPMFFLRRSKWRDLSAASTYHRRGTARVLVHCQRRSRSIVSEVTGSSIEAPRMRRRYRRNRFCHTGGAWLHNSPTILSGRTVFDNKTPTTSTSCVGCAACARFTTSVRRTQIHNTLKPAPGQLGPGYADN